ncbi:ATP-binding cassette domain-containing protein [Candidatus Mycoplasma pogonae]
MQKILEVKMLSKTFGSKKIFENLEFVVDENEVICFIGKNGSGKTTLFNILLNQTSKNFGEIKFSNPKIKIAFFNQEENTEEVLSVNKILSLIEYSLKKDEIKKAFFEEMKKILVNPKNLKTQVRFLSGGEKQKFALLQVIANFPKILILDEYSNNLDDESIKNIKQFLLKLVNQYGTTILIASHKVTEMINFVDKIFLIKNKKIEHTWNTKNFSEKQFIEILNKI